jgi:peptidoglycan/xylan/chitin deacetylase (PgdA/CDA1 family)
MALVLTLVALGALALAHTAPFPFLLEYIGPDRSLWRMPRSSGAPTVYLTFDDGPNPDATPALLDVLAREGVRATFFIIPRHVNEDTAPIVRRLFEDGHAVALHWHSRELMLKEPKDLAATLDAAAESIERRAGRRPCDLFRPHAGWRGGQMYEGLARSDRRLAGWSYRMWDFNWWRAQKPERLAARLASRASDGSIIVMHDGHHENPRADRAPTVTATAELIPALRARGFAFGTLCGDRVGRAVMSEAVQLYP